MRFSLLVRSTATFTTKSVNTVPEEGIYRYGNEEQKKRLLVPLAKGTKLAGIGFTEPDTGSDPALITTAAKHSGSTAKRSGRGWVINGQKMWCTFADGADFILLVARATPYDPANRHAGIAQFLTSWGGKNSRLYCHPKPSFSRGGGLGQEPELLRRLLRDQDRMAGVTETAAVLGRATVIVPEIERVQLLSENAAYQ